ncbi:MAG: hypothetical protein M3541_00260, partial [Acidobacteriota bacterium]|nr:hypothetical protein [Acidobacteriota bacterium]
MNTRTPQLFAVAALATLAYGCGNSASTSTNVTTPASARCEGTVSTPSAQFSSAGGTGTLAIAVARECSWRATSPVNWIVFTTAVEGQGEGSVSYRITENPDPVNRQASVSVADRQVVIAQQPAPCNFTVTGPQAAIDAPGGLSTIEVRTHSACSWTAVSDQPWATVAPGSGRGDGSIRVTVTANTGASRQTDVIVAGQRVTVRQNALGAPPVPAPGPTPTPTPPAPGPAPTPTPPAPGPTPT